MNFVAVSYILPFVVKVNHPNVIRLLGACTDPGGPLYLIMEFALHGSLRWAYELFQSQAIPLTEETPWDTKDKDRPPNPFNFVDAPKK